MHRAAPVEPEPHPFPRMQGVGADGFVSIDIPCRTCGYDLRALSVDAKCPECGTDVLFSLRSEQLCDANPIWVDRLASGANWIATTLVAQFLVGCIGRPLFFGDVGVKSQVDAAFLFPWMAGVWMLSRPDPDGRGEREYGHLRRWWFTLAIVLVAFDLAELPCASLPTSLLPVLHIVQRIIYLSTAFIGLRYLVGLSRRMSDAALRVRAHVLSISLSACNAGILLIAVMQALPQAPSARSWTIVPVAVGMLVYAVTAVLYVLMLGRFADRLRSQEFLAASLIRTK